MHSQTHQRSSLVPVLALLSILAATAWLPAFPAVDAERVLALFQNNRPEQTQIPDTLLLPRSEFALLPQYAPWGWP